MYRRGPGFLATGNTGLCRPVCPGITDGYGPLDRFTPGLCPGFNPLSGKRGCSGIFKVSRVTQTSGIGPMSAVAGAVALKVGENLKKRFGIKEVIVENGGIFMPTSVRIWIFRYLPVLPPCLKRSVCISRQLCPPRDLYLFRNRRSVTQLR